MMYVMCWSSNTPYDDAYAYAAAHVLVILRRSCLYNCIMCSSHGMPREGRVIYLSFSLRLSRRRYARYPALCRRPR